MVRWTESEHFCDPPVGILETFRNTKSPPWAAERGAESGVVKTESWMLCDVIGHILVRVTNNFKHIPKKVIAIIRLRMFVQTNIFINTIKGKESK